jgi:hypothetical protein
MITGGIYGSRVEDGGRMWDGGKERDDSQVVEQLNAGQR